MRCPVKKLIGMSVVSSGVFTRPGDSFAVGAITFSAGRVSLGFSSTCVNRSCHVAFCRPDNVPGIQQATADNKHKERETALEPSTG
ncbi:hypothetical protein F4Z99_08865 [Candidatus Poribacteria bacterium]|nr:hypothetical protein [Candidatus Poribacteria bacterium]